MGTVIEPHTTPKAPMDREWDWHGTREKDKSDELIQVGGWDALANAHAWYDPNADPEHDPPHEKQAYKLPHHEELGGRVRVVWAGVRSAMQVLGGARGGVDIPRSDVKDVYRHLAKHYEEFDKQPPAYDEIAS
jgi:hypothetical protein